MPARLIAVWLLAGVLALLLAAAAAAATSVTPTVIPSEDGPAAGPMRLADGSEHWRPGFGVERDPIIRLDFWGPDWEHDSTGVVAGIEALFRELPDSAWGSVLEQYGVHDDARLAGVLIDSRRPPHRTPLTRADAAREAARARRILRSGSGGQWIIVPQAATNLGRLDGECGEHDVLKSGPHKYLVDLVLADALDCSGLGISNETAAEQVVFAYTITVSHEFAEAATDSDRIGWANSSGNELADVCELADSVPVDMTVATAGLWSNQAGGCVSWWPNAAPSVDPTPGWRQTHASDTRCLVPTTTRLVRTERSESKERSRRGRSAAGARGESRAVDFGRMGALGSARLRTALWQPCEAAARRERPAKRCRVAEGRLSLAPTLRRAGHRVVARSARQLLAAENSNAIVPATKAG